MQKSKMEKKQEVKRVDSEVMQNEQGLLLFAPNLQSFGLLPKGHMEGTSSKIREDNLPTDSAQYSVLQTTQRGNYLKSEEDVHSDGEEESQVLGNDDSLERASSSAQIGLKDPRFVQSSKREATRSILEERSITKVSSSRRLDDQGKEGYLNQVGLAQIKDADSNKKYSRNETFAAGSQAHLLTYSDHHSLNSGAKQGKDLLGAATGQTSSSFHQYANESQTSENFMVADNLNLASAASRQLSRTEAEHVLASGLVLSQNQQGWLRTLCKDICSLMINKPLGSSKFNAEVSRSSIEGLFQVLQWRLDNSITPVEFTQIYAEWLRSNGHIEAPKFGNILQELVLEMPLNQDTLGKSQSDTLSHLRLKTSHFEESMIDLVQIGTRQCAGNINTFLANVPRMIELIKSEFNSQLVKENIVDDLWLQIVERLYAQLDFEQGHLAGCGSLSADRMQYFLLTLLLNEIKAENWQRIPEIVQKQTHALMANMRQAGGFVTLRDFKIYLLCEGVRSKTDIQVLYEHFEIILKTYHRSSKTLDSATFSRKESMGDLGSSSGSTNQAQNQSGKTSSSFARQVYLSLKQKIFDAESAAPREGTSQAEASSILQKPLLKNTLLPQAMAYSAFTALPFSSQEVINKALSQLRNSKMIRDPQKKSKEQLTLFEFCSFGGNVSESLESASTLWKYSMQRVLSLGNELALLQGTYTRDKKLEELTHALAEHYKQQDSWVMQGFEQISLVNYFHTLLSSYRLMNSEILFQMCNYLNQHIDSAATDSKIVIQDNSGSQEFRISSPKFIHENMHASSAKGSTHTALSPYQRDSHQMVKNDTDAQSELFSVKQFSSNQKHQAANFSQDASLVSNNLQDSRPSFGNSYVNNFMREEEQQRSREQQKSPQSHAGNQKSSTVESSATAQVDPSSSSNMRRAAVHSSGGKAPQTAIIEHSQGAYVHMQATSGSTATMHKMASVAIFGEAAMADLTPQESTIKLQDQDGQDSSLSLKRMGLEDSTNDPTAYASLPNNSGYQETNKRYNMIEDELKIERPRVPLTTKNGNQILDETQGMLANQEIENVEEPSQFNQVILEERLPRFQINLNDLKKKNLHQKTEIKDFALEESSGIGLMLSRRQPEVQKLPRINKTAARQGKMMQNTLAQAAAIQEQFNRTPNLFVQSSTDDEQRGDTMLIKAAGSTPKLQDGSQLEQRRHLSNVRSVDDVLSNLSNAKSPKFHAKMLENGSNPLLSIDSPQKFNNVSQNYDKSGQIPQKDLKSAHGYIDSSNYRFTSVQKLAKHSNKNSNGRQGKFTGGQAELSQQKKRAQSALISQLRAHIHSDTEMHQVVPSTPLIESSSYQTAMREAPRDLPSSAGIVQYPGATDTPSFSFQDHQSSRIFSNNNNNAPTLSQNQTLFSMKTDGTLVKSHKNTSSMQPLSSASYSQNKNHKRLPLNGALKDAGNRTGTRQSSANRRDNQERRSMTQMSQHAASPRSTMSALLPQISKGMFSLQAGQTGAAAALTQNMSSLQIGSSSQYGGRENPRMQKRGQQWSRATSHSLQAHISKSSLRRIENYEDVLARLKTSVMQALNHRGSGAKDYRSSNQKNISSSAKGQARLAPNSLMTNSAARNQGKRSGAAFLSLSSANPAQVDFLQNLQDNSEPHQMTSAATLAAVGLTKRHGKGLQFEKIPSKQPKQTKAILQQRSVWRTQN